MPTTVTASNGTTYHLWQLPDLSAPEPEDSVQYTTLDNEMAAGFRSSTLIGEKSGVRSWTLELPTLADTSVFALTVTDPDGASVSREQYVRNLYKKNRTTGTPFAYADPSTGQYYLVDFAGEPLRMKRPNNQLKLYATAFELQQRRLAGVTIFDVSKTTASALGYDQFDARGQSGTTWTNQAGGGSLTTSGDVTLNGSTQNGLSVARFNGSSTGGYASGTPNVSTIFEVFVVCKFREGSFSTTEDLVIGGSGSPIILRGSSGNTFFNVTSGATSRAYYLNGVKYAENAKLAPMNVWGVINFRNFNGWTLSGGLKIGASCKADIAEVISFGSLANLQESREILEYLRVKWGI